MKTIVAWIKFTLVILSMLILILGAYLVAPFSIKLYRYPIRKLWAICLILSTGAKFRLHGEDLSNINLENTMIVSNHISWLDTVIMLRIFFVRYVGKVEMLQWPILRVLLTGGKIVTLITKFLSFKVFITVVIQPTPENVTSCASSSFSLR